MSYTISQLKTDWQGMLHLTTYYYRATEATATVPLLMMMGVGA